MPSSSCVICGEVMTGTDDQYTVSLSTLGHPSASLTGSMHGYQIDPNKQRVESACLKTYIRHRTDNEAYAPPKEWAGELPTISAPDAKTGKRAYKHPPRRASDAGALAELEERIAAVERRLAK